MVIYNKQVCLLIHYKYVCTLQFPMECLVCHMVLACHLAAWPEIQDMLSNFNVIFYISINIYPIYDSLASNLTFPMPMWFMCNSSGALRCSEAGTMILLLFITIQLNTAMLSLNGQYGSLLAIYLILSVH